MVKSFFGLDLKTGVKVVFCANLIECFLLYIIGLFLMISTEQSLDESMNKFQSIDLSQDEIVNQIRLGD